jgi:mannonate dehydratase
MAAAAHIDTAIPNFGIQEYMGYPPETSEVFHSEVRLEDGYLRVAETPGLGVEYDDAAAARFAEFSPKYLPVARRLDGTVHDW